MTFFFPQIGEVKYFTTSDSRRGHRLEVKLFDDTVSTFPLIWCVMLLNFFENNHNILNIYRYVFWISPLTVT